MAERSQHGKVFKIQKKPPRQTPGLSFNFAPAARLLTLWHLICFPSAAIMTSVNCSAPRSLVKTRSRLFWWLFHLRQYCWCCCCCCCCWPAPWDTPTGPPMLSTITLCISERKAWCAIFIVTIVSAHRERSWRFFVNRSRRTLRKLMEIFCGQVILSDRTFIKSTKPFFAPSFSFCHSQRPAPARAPFFPQGNRK